MLDGMSALRVMMLDSLTTSTIEAWGNQSKHTHSSYAVYTHTISIVTHATALYILLNDYPGTEIENTTFENMLTNIWKNVK